MKLSTGFAALALVVEIAFALPAPHHGAKRGRHGLGSKGMVMAANSTASGSAVGAAFFLSNDPKGNAVIVNTIADDGTLSFASAIPTGGLGAHGVTSPNGPDAMFSQGSVKVLGNMLFAVNAGSNTISMFNIDMTNPDILTMAGAPIGSEGEFPMSLAVSEVTKNVCVLNGGANNGVACFSATAETGMAPLANTARDLKVNQTTPPNGPAGTMSHVIFSEDGTQLFAAVKGVPPTPGFLAAFDVAQDGSLSSDFTTSTPASGGLLPFGMTAIPGTKAVLSTDAAVGYTIFDFSAGSNATNAVFPIEGQGATCWVAHSTKTGNFYLTDLDTSIVTEVNVDSNLNSTIVAQYPQGNSTGSIDDDIASINGNDFLYVLLSNATTITVSSLDAPGKATPVQSFDVAAAMQSAGVNVTVDPFNVQGMTLYLTGSSSTSSSNSTGSNSTSIDSNSTSTDSTSTSTTVSIAAASASASSAPSKRAFRRQIRW